MHIKPGTPCMVKVPPGELFSDVNGYIVVALEHQELLPGLWVWRISPPVHSKDAPGEPLDWAKAHVLYPLDNPTDDMVDEISQVKEMV